MRSCWWWLTSVHMLSEPTQCGPENNVQTICGALPYIITGNVGQLCFAVACRHSNKGETLLFFFLLGGYNPSLSLSLSFLLFLFLRLSFYCRITSSPLVVVFLLLLFLLFLFSFLPTGVWDWPGGLSDPEAALLREVLQQDQAEQRGWRELRPHHGERTDPGMTLRHSLSLTLSPPPPSSIQQTHCDLSQIGSYVTVSATKHEIHIIARWAMRQLGRLDSLPKWVMDGEGSVKWRKVCGFNLNAEKWLCSVQIYALKWGSVQRFWSSDTNRYFSSPWSVIFFDAWCLKHSSRLVIKCRAAQVDMKSLLSDYLSVRIKNI